MPQIPLNVMKLGSGEPLIMLHGWQQSSDNLYPLGELLAPYAEVHLVDLPGFGSSPAPPSTFGSADYARVILEYMDEAKIDRADFLGHSFGGKVSIQAAAAAPKRVRRLVLAGSAGLQRKLDPVHKIRRGAIRVQGKVLKKVDSLFHSRFYESYFIPRYASRDYLKAGPLRSILVRVVNEDLSDLIAQIKVPALLLWGEDDDETPISMAYEMNRLLEYSRLIVLPHRGHNCLEDIESHLCAVYIRDFLKHQEFENAA